MPTLAAEMGLAGAENPLKRMYPNRATFTMPEVKAWVSESTKSSLR